ncbi:Ribosomal large subunit pseudouridine synthase D [Candidatus Nasuia deltocephalinicola]|uniref:Ribosomal large subunit pseudouridine synthase D n=1 Tax=Candidatus Nasuia deltocephalincola TaxID=1160784 RepID=A0A0S2UPB8_9PROT|nr:Ribosomal large subunit pseudouridine synthase D [Candidatus Nasuia deltocephalinicola]
MKKKYKFNFFFFLNIFLNFRFDFLLCKYFFYFSRSDIKYFIFKNINFYFYFKKFFIFLLFFNKFIKLNFNFNFYLPIYYETNCFFLLNKPFNIVIHNFINSFFNNNLINNLIYFYGKNFLFFFRLGFLNRIDKDTTGLIVISKKNFFYINYLNQFINNLIVKNYLIYVFGFIKNLIIKSFFFFKKKNINFYFNSNTRLNLLFKINYFNYKISIINCFINTGRTHQIRIHLNFIKKYIICDNIYNNTNKKNFFKYLNRQCIHLFFLSFFYQNINIFFLLKNYYDMTNLIKFVVF